MRRILIAIGCDSYEHLPSLEGAEKDAAAVSEVLTRGDYDRSSSRLLLSPSLADVRAALSALPFGSADIESLTFFFAGHGGTKSGTYYLCLHDTSPERLSTTGLALSHVLSVITELKPIQANILIDACQSGSAMLDSASLLRADALGLGNPVSLSIAFLAACGPNEYAKETGAGGALTTRVLKYIRGDDVLQTTRPSLDLIDLGRRVSAELAGDATDQVPVSWGINLTGEGRFANNPRFAPATEDLAKVASALASSGLDQKTHEARQAHAFTLWSEHRALQKGLDVRSLRNALASVVTDLSPDKAAVALVLRGLATSLRASAAVSADVFAEPLVLYACAEPLLSILDEPIASETARQLLDEAAQTLAQVRTWLLRSLKTDRYCLLGEGNGLADLYFLPLRLTRILGWLGVGLEVDNLLGRDASTAWQEVDDITKLILQHYAGSLVPRSDAQAPLILAFFRAAKRHGSAELLEQVIGCYFGGFVDSKGIVARPDISGDQAFSFALGLAAGPGRGDHRFRANPTQFSSALLICGVELSLDDEWDPDLVQLDHHVGNMFVPHAYRDFAVPRIEAGKNFSFQIGQDVWTLQDFKEFTHTHVVPALKVATQHMSPLAASLALVASGLQPDRLPLHLLTDW